jgi:uncharacterized protein (DUF2062 family)
MPRKLFRKYLPSNESVRNNRAVRFLGTALHHHNLWHLNRKSVAGGVAIGMFAGMIPGPVQIISAAILSVLLRVNLPVAAIVTFYTNPFTIVPLYYAAYKVGQLAIGRDVTQPPREHLDLLSLPVREWMPALFAWVYSMGKPFIVGSLILAVIFAVLGYVLVIIGWRIHVWWSWRKRRRTRLADAKRGVTRL